MRQARWFTHRACCIQQARLSTFGKLRLVSIPGTCLEEPGECLFVEEVVWVVWPVLG